MTLWLWFRRMYESLLAGRNSVLSTGSPGLLERFVYIRYGRQLLALPGVDVEFNRGRIMPHQIEGRRQSYIHALLIQSRGRTLPVPCTSCRGSLGTRTFPECRHVPGAFGGACANCKWPDQAIRCSVRDENWVDVAPASIPAVQTGGGSQLVRALGSSQSPINLDPEEGEQGNPINLEEEEEDEEEGDEENPIVL